MAQPEQLDLVQQCGYIESRKKQIDLANARTKADIQIAMHLSHELWVRLNKRIITEGDMVVMSQLCTEIVHRITMHAHGAFEPEREGVIYTDELEPLRECAATNFNQLEQRLKALFARE